MTLIDTADVYGLGPAANFGDSELLLGEVFSEAAGLRDRIILATKGGIDPGVPYHTSKQHMLQACEDSLKRLGVETIDLYQVHRPDFLTHPEELAEALTALRESGKVREVGVSNYSVSQYRGLQSCLSFPIVSRQPEFSAWHLDPLFDGVLDQCMEEKLTVLAWSPLAGGLLANAGGSASPESELRLAGLLKCLDALAVKRECSRVTIALSFVLGHPAGIVPIIGTQQLDRIRTAAEAVACELTHPEWYQILQAGLGKPLP